MTVFITCPSRNWLVSSLDELERQYGPLRAISDRYVYGDEIEDGRLPDSFQYAIDDAAARFDPSVDFVLIGGDYVQLMALIVALTNRHGKFCALRWDKKAEGFLPVWFGTLDAARRSRLDPRAAAVLG